MVGKDPLYTDPGFAQFYDLENGWGDDFAYCANMAKHAVTVLDLGCGTGELLAAIAPKRAVGVDPAGAMLDIARRRKGGEQVEWVQADARSLELGERFDLIVLTSHAFQVFLTDADQSAALDTIRRHLAPNGRFVFDTRNPANKVWAQWTPKCSKRSLMHPKLGEVNVWNDAQYDAASQVVSYQTHYHPERSAHIYAANSRIRFTAQPVLAERLKAAGLTVSNWLGNWQGAPITATAPEIIPIGQLSR
jgi:ubiquinone/menaquinone biosynthesis C-methylase UbiE